MSSVQEYGGDNSVKETSEDPFFGKSFFGFFYGSRYLKLCP